MAQRRKLTDPSSSRRAKQDGQATDKKSHLAYVISQAARLFPSALRQYQKKGEDEARIALDLWDILWALQNKVNNKIDSKNKLMVIGILEHGYTLQMLGMKSFGHVALLCPLASDVEIPTDLVTGGKLLARPLQVALGIRQHVLNTRTVIQEAYLDESPSQATLIPSSTPKVIQDRERKKSNKANKPSSKDH